MEIKGNLSMLIKGLATIPETPLAKEGDIICEASYLQTPLWRLL